MPDTPKQTRAAKLAYQVAYRAAHHEKLVAQNRARRARHHERILAEKAAYRAKYREELAEKQRAYYAAHRQECVARSRDYMRANPERRRAYDTEHKERITAQKKEWATAHKTRLAPRKREWHRANKEKAREYKQANRLKIQATRKDYNVRNKAKITVYNARPEIIARKAISARDHKDRNPEKYKTYYTTSQAKVLAQLEATAGRPRPPLCEVCDRPNKSGRGMHFDHCHKGGHFRGWLCSHCNNTLGMAGDNPEILRKLIAYLEAARGIGGQAV